MAKGYKTGARRKGTPNKLTRDLREMILGALADAGGRAYLVAQAKKNPGAFLTLVGKLLPSQATGNDDGPIEVELLDFEVARRLAFLLARGAQALDCPEPERSSSSRPAPPAEPLSSPAPSPEAPVRSPRSRSRAPLCNSRASSLPGVPPFARHEPAPPAEAPRPPRDPDRVSLVRPSDDSVIRSHASAWRPDA
jgi:hypothetical protein